MNGKPSALIFASAHRHSNASEYFPPVNSRSCSLRPVAYTTAASSVGNAARVSNGVLSHAPGWALTGPMAPSAQNEKGCSNRVSTLSLADMFNAAAALNAMGSLNSKRNVDVFGTKCADTKISAEGFPHPSYAKLCTSNSACKLNANLDFWNDRKTIVGETIGGAKMTIHCNPGNCTVGSLNRFSILSRAPMMVPARMLDTARKAFGHEFLDDSGLWKTVASVIWSDPKKLTKITETYDDENKADVVKYKIEDDVNTIRAKAIYDADPTAYKSKRLAFIESAHIENKVGVLITKGFVSTAETGDPGVVVSTYDDEVVVTETVVTCTSQGQTDCVDAHDQ